MVGEVVPWPEEVVVDYKCSIDSNEGRGGGGLVVLGGKVKGGGVDFGVVNSLLGEIPRDVMGERGGETFGVDGGPV
ncbi:hypothetical protein Tco_0675818 [Tanacetum coccineum]